MSKLMLDFKCHHNKWLKLTSVCAQPLCVNWLWEGVWKAKELNLEQEDVSLQT